MINNVKTLKDAVDDLALSLQAPYIFPAGLFIFVHLYVFLPVFISIDLHATTTIILAVACALVLSYSLYAYNFPLIRLLEGYKLSGDVDHKKLLNFQQKQYWKLQKKTKCLDERREQLYSKKALTKFETEELEYIESLFAYYENELDENFPPGIDNVLSTSLGNAIAAFESYSYGRYGIDTISVWPRLVPILKETKYLDFVAHEKAVFDFLMNMFFVILVLGVEGFYLSVYVANWWGLACIVVGVPSLLIVLYLGLVVAAKTWGLTVRVAFDLHRHTLRQRLGLKATKSFIEEYRQWQSYSQFLMFRPKSVTFKGFISSSEFDAKLERNENVAH